MGVVGIYTLEHMLQAPCVRDIYHRRHYRDQRVAEPSWVAQQAGRLYDVVE